MAGSPTHYEVHNGTEVYEFQTANAATCFLQALVVETVATLLMFSGVHYAADGTEVERVEILDERWEFAPVKGRFA